MGGLAGACVMSGFPSVELADAGCESPHYADAEEMAAATHSRSFNNVSRRGGVLLRMYSVCRCTWAAFRCQYHASPISSIYFFHSSFLNVCSIRMRSPSLPHIARRWPIYRLMHRMSSRAVTFVLISWVRNTNARMGMNAD